MAVYVRVRDPDQLRARMSATRYTQAALARAINVSGARISQVLSGQVGTSLAAAAAIEDALDVPRGTYFEIRAPGDLIRPYIVPKTGAA